jgi:hypothetical protein
MSDSPLLGSPTAICTHPDGRFSVEFEWEAAPDALWLKAVGDLMKRSGREAIELDQSGLRVSFLPQDADGALDDLAALLEDADRHYAHELEQRDAAIRFVQESLQTRYGMGPELPVKEL